MEWVSVKDRLPQKEPSRYRSRIIVYGSPSCGTHSSDFDVMEAYYHEDGYFEFGEYDCGIDVTHWMPLPKPPKDT